MKRKNTRYREYDYSQGGGYFVTLCAHKKQNLFGEITDGKVILTPIGKIVERCWQEIPNHFDFVESGAFVIMPNHMHGIILINENNSKIATVGAKHASPLRLGKGGHGSPPGSLSAIIASFKSSATRIARITQHFQGALWQRNYYDHIIRSERDWAALHEYIQANLESWQKNPDLGG